MFAFKWQKNFFMTAIDLILDSRNMKKRECSCEWNIKKHSLRLVNGWNVAKEIANDMIRLKARVTHSKPSEVCEEPGLRRRHRETYAGAGSIVRGKHLRFWKVNIPQLDTAHDDITIIDFKPAWWRHRLTFLPRKNRREEFLCRWSHNQFRLFICDCVERLSCAETRLFMVCHYLRDAYHHSSLE